jgi:putative OmpL-like beta-barrel porin-2
MKKLVLASTVSAAFAAPATALAQAVPTLDKILDASGISVSGYIDTAYSYANKNIDPATGGFPIRVFDSQNNSFALHQFGLTVAKQPKEGFGGLVNLTVGSDAEVIHSFPEAAGPKSSMFDVTQAFAQYAKGPLTLMAGKFTTLHGTEVIASTGNTNFSRSILFGAVPFTHTGVRASYAASDTATLYAGVNNGWDQLTDSNKGKTLELGATLNPIKPLTLTISDYYGKETVPIATPGSPEGMRNSFNAVASYAISDPLSIGLEFLSVSQDNGTATGGTAKYSGFAGYVTYMFNPKWRAALRGESFDDKDGFHFGTGTKVKYTEGTVTISYLPSASFELRGEVRTDRADTAVFTDSTGAASKSLVTAAVQGIYKF